MNKSSSKAVRADILVNGDMGHINHDEATLDNETT